MGKEKEVEEKITESEAQKRLNKRLKLQRSERDDLDENGVKKEE